MVIQSPGEQGAGAPDSDPGAPSGSPDKPKKPIRASARAKFGAETAKEETLGLAEEQGSVGGIKAYAAIHASMEGELLLISRGMLVQPPATPRAQLPCLQRPALGGVALDSP